MLVCVFCFFQLGIFVDVKTFHDPEWKLLSVSFLLFLSFSLYCQTVSISGMSILVENWGYNSESWSGTLIKQLNNGIKIT